MAGDKSLYWDLLIRRSVSRFFLLAALSQRPMHGYELRKFISEACQGCCQPSEAMIYPALRELLEEGSIQCEVESQGERERKVCRLTPKGERSYQVAAQSWAKFLPYLAKAVEDSQRNSLVKEVSHGPQER